MMAWHDPQIIAAFISAGATFVAAALGFAAIWWQIGRQARATIAANNNSEAMKRKVEIYEQTLSTSAAAQKALHDLAVYLRGFVISVEFAQALRSLKMTMQRPPHRYLEYRNLTDDAVAKVMAVSAMIESWHIIEPKLHIFREALSMGLFERREIASQDGRSDVLLHTMPLDDQQREWVIPEREQVQHVRARVADEADQLDRLAAWVGDFQVEMQILLLSELFPNTVARRNPPDPREFCIRLDRYEEISRLLDKSPSRQRHAAFEAQARNNFRAQNDSGNIAEP